MDITILADNGGGLTLQLTDTDGRRYQHCYDDPTSCARDIRAAQKDGHCRQWEGNELEEDGAVWLEPTDEEIGNGGYRVLSPDRLDPDSSWRDIAALSQALAPA